LTTYRPALAFSLGFAPTTRRRAPNGDHDKLLPEAQLVENVQLVVRVRQGCLFRGVTQLEHLQPAAASMEIQGVRGSCLAYTNSDKCLLLGRTAPVADGQERTHDNTKRTAGVGRRSSLALTTHSPVRWWRSEEVR
jgi:hypothetical protein